MCHVPHDYTEIKNALTSLYFNSNDNQACLKREGESAYHVTKWTVVICGSQDGSGSSCSSDPAASLSASISLLSISCFAAWYTKTKDKDKMNIKTRTSTINKQHSICWLEECMLMLSEVSIPQAVKIIRKISGDVSLLCPVLSLAHISSSYIHFSWICNCRITVIVDGKVKVSSNLIKKKFKQDHFLIKLT